MTRHPAGTLAAAILSAGGCLSSGYSSKPRVAVVNEDPIVQMAPPGRFRSLSNPRLVPFRQHSDPPFRDEKIVGVALGSASRMYPIGLLDSYEVVNDEAGGIPYVVARCALTDLAAAFDRRVAGRTLTFENSGALWRDMLVLRDRETGTYWEPATGAGLFGPLAGERLSPILAPLTTAEAWEELYPAAVCLETGDLTAVPLRLKLYAVSGWEGVSGRKAADRRYPPKERVLFVGEGSEAVAFRAADVRRRRAIQAEIGGRPLTIEWDAGLRAPRAYVQVVAAKQERPVIPIYWFALVRHFPTVRTLIEGGASSPPSPR